MIHASVQNQRGRVQRPGNATITLNARREGWGFVADLTFGDVLLIGGVATIGFTLVSYWFSGVMSRKGWSWQVRKAPKKRKDPKQAGR